MADQFAELPLEKVFWTNPIRDIRPEDIKDMATSILVHGQIEPIVVKPANEEEMHEGVVGRLRYEAVKERWKGDPKGKTVLARIHEFRNDIEVRMWQLAENLHRRELPAMEKARAYKELYESLREKAIVTKPESTVSTIAKALEELTGDKTAEKTVYHYLSLTELTPETQKVLTGEKMGLRHGLELLRVKDPKRQETLAEEAAKEEWTVNDLKNQVTWRLQEERSEHQRKRVEKKAEELRAEGKIVHTSYEPYTTRDYQTFYGEPPEPCASCDRKGIVINANFHQEPICVDPDCWKKTREERNLKEEAELKAREAEITTEQAKIYALEPDVRHWRLTLYGLVDDWELKRLLGVSREDYELGGRPGAVWKRILELSEEDVKGLLIRKAVEDVMTGPDRWGRDRDVKEWAIQEFGLRREIFLPEKGGDVHEEET